jgi:cysteine-rich repeat protein
MRIKVASLSVLLAAALLGACGAEDDGAESSQDPFLFGIFKCGNGRIDGREQCDRKNLNGETCSSVTMGAKPGGTLKCNIFCRFDTRGCKRSGTGGTGGGGGAAGGGAVGGGGGIGGAS